MKELKESQNFRIIGFTDSVNECDCCGKTELKGTYVMADDLDNELYFGVVCGAKAAGKSVDYLKNEVKEINTKSELSLMVLNASNDFAKRQVLKFVAKKKLNLEWFIKKYGTIIDKINDFTVYSFGPETYNF